MSHTKRSISSNPVLAVIAGWLWMLLPLTAAPLWQSFAAAAEPATQPAAQPVLEQARQLPPISLSVGHSTLIRSTTPISRVSVTEPKIATVESISPTQVMIQGKAVGSTDVIIWGEGDQASQATVLVGVDRSDVGVELNKLLPDANLKVETCGDMLAVTGRLDRAEDAQALHKFLEAAQLKYVDKTTVTGVQQVQIRVKVAEASRTAIRTLGINAVQGGGSFFGGDVVGPDGGGPLNPVSIGMPGGASITQSRVPFLTGSGGTQVGPASTIFAGFPDANLEIFVQALEENQYLRVLAEPNLVALSGQEATFLAGGEFPIPVAQGGTGALTITIDYKSFGVLLRFRPTVLGDGRIRLHVAPEVSELSNGTGSVQLSGFTIPAILTRRAETTMELNNGQTFAMAGLIDQETTARSSQVPGLGDLPVLGPMFRSVRYQEDDTELVLMVTASLVEPGALNADSPVPGSTYVPPTDWELYSQGRIEGQAAGKLSAADAQALRESGLGRLRGPGSWADWDSPAAPASASGAATASVTGVTPTPAPEATKPKPTTAP